MSKVNLPEGWTLARYEDVYLSASNGTGGTQNKDGLGIPVSRIETIASENIDYDRIGFLAAYDKDKVEKHKLVKGDILFSHINSPIHLGKTAIYDGKHPLYHGINLLRIIVNRQTACPRIFNWHCKYTRFQGEFSLRAQHAVNQSSINQKKLGAFEIALPPLAEQKVIADKLDTLLAQVETTKARLERIPQILKRFRQSVLAAAVRGRLTEQWRELNSSPFPYERRQLSEIICEMRNGLSPKPNEEGRGCPILRISSVRSFSIDQVDIRYLEVSKQDEGRYSLKPDDLLFTRYNGSIEFVGVCARVTRLDHNVLLYPDKLIRVRVDKDQVTPGFLEIFAASYEAREYIYSLVKSTSGQKGISGKDLKLMQVKLPSVSEQTEIVRRVDQLFAHTDRIVQQVQAAQERVNNLTQSILAKAFRGELTEQWRKDNPELISGENSAATLLERIKAERAATAKPERRPSKA